MVAYCGIIAIRKATTFGIVMGIVNGQKWLWLDNKTCNPLNFYGFMVGARGFEPYQINPKPFVIYTICRIYALGKNGHGR